MSTYSCRHKELDRVIELVKDSIEELLDDLEIGLSNAEDKISDLEYENISFHNTIRDFEEMFGAEWELKKLGFGVDGLTIKILLSVLWRNRNEKGCWCDEEGGYHYHECHLLQQLFKTKPHLRG